jgi:hypothetical protein
MDRKWIFNTGLLVSIIILSSGFKPNSKKFISWFHVSETAKIYQTVLTQEELTIKEGNSVSLTTKIPFSDEKIASIIKIVSKKSFEKFKTSLGTRESHCKYQKVNTLGYMGKYQFGKGTLQTLGIKDTAKFLESKKLQEKAFVANLSRNKSELKHEINKYVGKKVKGITVTESGILAAAHLGGQGSVKKFLKSNGKKASKDSYGTSVATYMKEFANFDTSKIKANKNAKAKNY